MQIGDTHDTWGFGCFKVCLAVVTPSVYCATFLFISAVEDMPLRFIQIAC
jgi:hypothetical protein